VKRLKNSDSVMTDSTVKKLRAAAEKRMGLPYDPYFNWDEKRIYCSELMWKCYNEATGLKIGELKPLKDFDLSSPVVQKKLKERYGDKIPSDVEMISPGAIFDSPLLVTVKTQ